MSTDENAAKAASLAKEARSFQMDVVYAACNVADIPQLATKILKPRVQRLCAAVEELASVTRGQASEPLKEGATGLRIALADLEESPSRGKVEGLRMKTDVINLEIGAALKPTN